TGLLGKSLNAPAHARAPLTNRSAPSFYRFKVGALEATVVSDGPIGPMGDPATMFVGASKEEVGRMLADNFLPADQVVIEQNALVVNTGERLVLFDTGTGATNMFGPTTGRLLSSLQVAGIFASDIDAVVLTHAHPDHCWGLMVDDGKPQFPNA